MSTGSLLWLVSSSDCAEKTNRIKRFDQKNCVERGNGIARRGSYLQDEHLCPADDVIVAAVILAAVHTDAGHAGHRAAVNRRGDTGGEGGGGLVVNIVPCVLAERENSSLFEAIRTCYMQCAGKRIGV